MHIIFLGPQPIELVHPGPRRERRRQARHTPGTPRIIYEQPAREKRWDALCVQLFFDERGHITRPLPAP